ncbi:MAG: hypothetical protein QF926_08395 [Alphaproteobacteria bacterium]|nr:hypothetical protein [Alphaproteobacteria bacterium]MDP6516625.1 hypothetical protein [Alphaproteobacteria bacterium]
MAEPGQPPKVDRRPLNIQLSDAITELAAVRKELGEREKIIKDLHDHALNAGENHEATTLTLTKLRQDYQNVCNILESKDREVAAAMRLNTIMIILLVVGVMVAVLGGVVF